MNKLKLKLITLFFITAGFALEVGYTQEINFSEYHSYTITLTNVNLDDLLFEGPITSGSGQHSVELADALALEIEGVKFLDVLVDITQISGGGYLTLDGQETTDEDKRIPFTLEAAYANRGNNNIADAKLMTVASNNASERFPILARLSQAPGPPPPPPTANFNQAAVNETAYIYLYGSINVGNVMAGTYSGDIQITVEYQ
ncbi:MAG: hypothetical protein WD381_04900 [Balneolaceae bacterium]